MKPKLRENVWHIYPDQNSATLLTSTSTYSVPARPALEFLKMRSYCTGYNSVDTIARRSGLSLGDVDDLLRSLQPAGIVYTPSAQPAEIPVETVRESFSRLAALWADELRLSYIGNEFTYNRLSRNVLLGWLLEMYHYIKDFPDAIQQGVAYASGELRDVLAVYADQERGHEVFVLRTLVNLGVSREEVETSIPLLSTRLIGLLMRELFQLAPWTTLVVAAIVEAQEFAADQIDAFKRRMQELYGIEFSAFDPYFQHQEIDVSMGHAELLSNHRDLIDLTDRATLDDTVNKIHDLKHAFDLQGQEVKSYYSALDGRYFPRQPVLFESI